MMGACYLLALFGLNRVAHHMRRLGAPANYQAPL
jgi:hypothetical protein